MQNLVERVEKRRECSVTEKTESKNLVQSKDNRFVNPYFDEASAVLFAVKSTQKREKKRTKDQ